MPSRLCPCTRSLMDLDHDKGIALYTDGSCDYNDRSGGFAWVAVDAYGNSESHAERVGDTTVNRMELTGVIEGLWAVLESLGPVEVLVHSDSQYVVFGCQDPNRARRKNRDLWAKMDKALDGFAVHGYVEFTHVRGHVGDKYNEIADELAGKARRSTL